MWVEDDKLIGTILSKKLISSGFDLFHAKTGEEAIEALKDAKPDVIVLDLLLPGVGGFDVLQAINKDNGLRNIPVMILSNLSKPTDVERAKLLGAKKFLIKAATSLEQIVKEIHELVGR
jgi:CheY-like chemotaxis protein